MARIFLLYLYINNVGYSCYPERRYRKYCGNTGVNQKYNIGLFYKNMNELSSFYDKNLMGLLSRNFYNVKKHSLLIIMLQD